MAVFLKPLVIFSDYMPETHIIGVYSINNNHTLLAALNRKCFIYEIYVNFCLNWIYFVLFSIILHVVCKIWFWRYVKWFVLSSALKFLLQVNLFLPFYFTMTDNKILATPVALVFAGAEEEYNSRAAVSNSSRRWR